MKKLLVSLVLVLLSVSLSYSQQLLFQYNNFYLTVNEPDHVVQVYDLSGKLVFNKQLMVGSNYIDLSKENAGYYVCSILNINRRVESFTIVKNQ